MRVCSPSARRLGRRQRGAAVPARHRARGASIDMERDTVIGEALLRHLTCFGELGAEDAAAARALDGEVRTYGRDHDIVRMGEKPTHSVIALSGMLHRYAERGDGARQIFGFYFATDAPCLETVHLDILDHNVAALVETRVGLIPLPALHALMDSRPRLLSLIWRQTLVQASMYRAWLMRNRTPPAHAALA